MARILAKGYNYGLNFLPHDAAATMKSGRTFQGELHDLGLRNTRIGPRTLDIWIGISGMRGSPSCRGVMTSAAKVEAESPLVQSAEFVDGNPVKLRTPDKIAAAKELTRICGWVQPNRIELSATDTLGEFIRSIREAGGPRQPIMAEHAEDNGERG
jgi:hypothetical protein